MNARLSSNSASLSPGKPTITSAPIAASGIRRARLQHPIRIVPRTVLAMHPPQHRVAAALQRRMNVLRNPRRLRHQTQQIVREVHRLDRTQPQPRHIRLRQQPPQQIRQPHAAPRFPAPPPQIDAAQHHFAIPRRQPAHLLHHLVRRQPAGRRSSSRRTTTISRGRLFSGRASGAAAPMFPSTRAGSMSTGTLPTRTSGRGDCH